MSQSRMLDQAGKRHTVVNSSQVYTLRGPSNLIANISFVSNPSNQTNIFLNKTKERSLGCHPKEA